MKLFFFTILLLVSCQRNKGVSDADLKYSESPPTKTYTLGVLPLSNPNRLHEVFGPLTKLINKEFKGVVFRLEASRDYADFNRKLKEGAFDISIPNPYQTLLSLSQGYEVFGKMADDKEFRGVIIVRKDSQIKEPKDLTGKTVCFPAPTALAAAMMPQSFLHDRGIDIKKDIKIRYLGSQESSIMGTYYKSCAASGTWPAAWHTITEDRPEVKNELKVIWQTKSLPNCGLVFKKGLDPEIVQTVRKVFMNLHNNKEGTSVLNEMNTSKFEIADNFTYAPVKAYIETFTKNVRNPEENQ